MNEKKILYITYDGLTDPLGQSQILPYLQGLSKFGYRFTILSFEKKERYDKLKSHIRKMLNDSSIEWTPLRFTTRPPLLAKLYDAFRMRRSAINLQLKHRFDGVHCRSYPASENGLYLKRRFGIKFIFDMRGFWADEKKDGGSWNIKNPLFRRIYRYYKFRESQFVSNADSIISLTEAGKIEMQKWSSYAVHVPLTVIPCCADMDHFTLRSQSVKEAVRKKLDIPHDVKVVSYLGSLGAWYMLEEMLGFFRLLKDRYPDALFLFISHSPSRLILSRLAFYGLAATDVRIVPAERADVPALAQAADVSVSFIRPVYSKISSSPTKLGELLVMGIPVVVNAGVGDVEQIVHSLDGGAVISDFTSNEFHRVLDDFPRLLTLNPAAIRSRAAKYYGLDIGVRKYAEVYDQLFNV